MAERLRWHGLLLLASGALLLLCARPRALGFVGSPRIRSPCQGASPAALSARGGESMKEALGLQDEISEQKAIMEFEMLVKHIFRPPLGEYDSLVEWSMDEKQEDSKKLFQASLKLVPLNQTFKSAWVVSGKKANKQAAQSAISQRLGDNGLGDAQATLSEILRNALDGDDVDIDIQEQEGQSFKSTLRLPAKLFAAAGSLPEPAPFEGEGPSMQKARQAAALKALLFLCASIGALPALKALGEKRTENMIGRGSSTVLFSNFSSEASEQSVRERFEQFGKVTDFEIQQVKSRSKGSVSYEHKLSAWIAPRMMDRSAIDDNVVYVTQRAAQVNVPGRSGSQTSWGKPVRPDCVLFYKNAPFQESFTAMLNRFREVGDVQSFRYWVDEKTQKSKGSGTIGFASAEAAQQALEKLKGMEVGGRQLEVAFYKKHEKAAGGKA